MEWTDDQRQAAAANGEAGSRHHIRQSVDGSQQNIQRVFPSLYQHTNLRKRIDELLLGNENYYTTGCYLQ